MKISKIRHKHIKKRSCRIHKGWKFCGDIKGKKECSSQFNKKKCFWLIDCALCTSGKCLNLSPEDKKRGYNTFNPYKKNYPDYEAEDSEDSYQHSTE